MVKLATDSADQDIAYVNKLMPSVSSGPVVAEVTRTRDDFVAIRATLRTMPGAG